MNSRTPRKHPGFPAFLHQHKLSLTIIFIAIVLTAVGTYAAYTQALEVIAKDTSHIDTTRSETEKIRADALAKKKTLK